MARPNLIIAGVNKAGTTSLFDYLATHPDIYPSSIKETCYFLPIRYGQPVPPVASYESFFSGYRGQEPVIMESTPGYFYGKRRLAEQVKQVCGEGARIVLCLRDPVGRAYSFFNFMQSRMQLPREMTFPEYVDRCMAQGPHIAGMAELNPYFGVEGGHYISYLPDWYEVFGSENIKLVYFEELAQQPHAVLKELCLWLGLSPSCFDAVQFSASNKTMPYKPNLLHRMAMRLNRAAEPVFRQFPAVKKALLSTYRTVNVDRQAMRPDNTRIENDRAAKVRLGEHYQPYNRQLSQYLHGRGVSRLPSWGEHGCTN